MKAPFASRQAMMRSAMAGPTRGRVSRAATSAVLRLTRVARDRTPGGDLADDRDNDLLPVSDEPREVQLCLVGSITEATGGSHRVDRAIALAKFVESWPFHSAENVYEDRAAGERGRG